MTTVMSIRKTNDFSLNFHVNHIKSILLESRKKIKMSLLINYFCL